MKKLTIEKGDKYGELTITKELPYRNKDKRRMFECLCVCGKTKIVALNKLRSSHTQSCGCLWDRIMKENSFASIHNHTRRHKISPTFVSWTSMMQRCYDKNNISYSRYGDKGIQVCKRWKDFTLFLQDMGERPPGLTLDRLDHKGNYEPCNCRWTDPVEQNREQRKLTDEQVSLIKKDKRNQYVIARDYNVSQTTISAIRTNKMKHYSKIK